MESVDHVYKSMPMVITSITAVASITSQKAIWEYLVKLCDNEYDLKVNMRLKACAVDRICSLIALGVF